jgi:hypothetical protein
MNISNPDFLTGADPAAHGGVERVIERAATIKQLFSEATSAKYLPSYVLGLTIMAAVTLTERALDGTGSGFAVEWIALSAVALVTFVLAADVSRRLTRSAQASMKSISARVRASMATARKARADEKLWAFAAQDSRVMNDILWAKGRSEELVDEPRLHRAVTVSHANVKTAARGDSLPFFSRYY